MSKAVRFLALVGVSFAIACGGDDGDGSSVDGVKAAFTSPESADVDTIVVFDASGSSSKNGALSYDWSFGNENRGSGRTIAKVFRNAGALDVTLTVTDSTGKQASTKRTVTLSAAPDAGTVAATGNVTTLDGIALEGVTVTDRRTGASATTDAAGNVGIAVAKGRGVVLELAKTGYAGQFVSVRYPGATGDDAAFNAVMRPRNATQDFDTTAGGTLTGSDGARVTFPERALVDEGGSAQTGTGQLAMTPVDITLPAAGGFPGEFNGVNGDGSSTPIVSFGTTEYAITAGGRPLNLAPGKRAIIELPLYANTHIDGTAITVGERIPLWSLDEESGVWVNEGDGEVVGSPDAPGGFVMRAEVGHFSWWNCDIGFDPTDVTPKCVPDVVPGADDYLARATICNMLADIDRGLGGNGNTNTLSLRPGNTQQPRLPGYAASTVVPVNGGLGLPVPANTDMIFKGSALNGTWKGETRLRTAGPGQSNDVVVTLQPVAAVIDGETITLPFDETRAVGDTTPVRLVFNSPGYKFVRITISSGDGSTLAGNIAVRNSGGDLVTRTFASFATSFTQAVVAPGAYGIVITPTSGAPGSFHLRAELEGTVQDTPISALPYTGNASAGASTVARSRFTVTGPTGLSGTTSNTGTIQTRIANASGTTVSAASNGKLTAYLQSAGTYSLEVYANDASAAYSSLTLQQTVWPAVAELNLGTSQGYGSDATLLRGERDTNGAVVVGVFVGAGNGKGRVELHRLTGSTLARLVTVDDITFSEGCTNFGFDAGNNPVVIDLDPESYNTGSARLRARRYVSGAWENLGADGLLPAIGESSGCGTPVITLYNGNIAVAYNVDSRVFVQRFDGTNWVGLDSPPGGLQANAYGAAGGGSRSYAFAVSPDGKPTLAYAPSSSNSSTRVRQFNGTAWTEVGGDLTTALPNGYVMNGPLGDPQLAFDAQNRPRVAGSAGVSSGGVGTTEMYVFTFDNAAWSSNGPVHYSVADGYANSGQWSHVYFNGASHVLYRESASTSSYTVVKRYDGTWSSLGADRGQVDLSDSFYRHLVVSNGALYLVVQVQGSPQIISVRRYTP